MLEAVPAALVAGFSPWTLLIVAELLSREHPMRLALHGRDLVIYGATVVGCYLTATGLAHLI